MRVVLALTLFAPLVAMIAVLNGAERVLPLMMAMSAIALVAQLFIEMRRRS